MPVFENSPPPPPFFFFFLGHQKCPAEVAAFLQPEVRVWCVSDVETTEDGRVVVCRDSVRNACKRALCKYYHIPVPLPPSTWLAKSAPPSRPPAPPDGNLHRCARPLFLGALWLADDWSQVNVK